MYVIGLIDDEESQLSKMRRVIKTNEPIEVQPYIFKSYSLSQNAGDVVAVVSDQVMQDILSSKLSALIIDYKIMIKTTKVKGTDIFRRVREEVPKFPVIILTEVVEESLKPVFIDADKVYKKKDFYKLESEYSKEKVANIFDSMKKYTEQKDKLQLTMRELKQKLVDSDNKNAVIEEIMVNEKELNNFIPTDQSQIEKVFDTNKIKKVITLIEQANKLLES